LLADVDGLAGRRQQSARLGGELNHSVIHRPIDGHSGHTRYLFVFRCPPRVIAATTRGGEAQLQGDDSEVQPDTIHADNQGSRCRCSTRYAHIDGLFEDDVIDWPDD